MGNYRRKLKTLQKIVSLIGCISLLGMISYPAEADELRMIPTRLGTQGGSPKCLTPAGDNLYFIAFSQSTGYRELFKTDGTVEGTVRLTSDIDCSLTSEMLFVNDKLFFNASINSGLGAVGTELFVSDGTEAGTGLVKDINPGPPPNNSFPKEFAAHNGLLFFQAEDNGSDLWKSDGTEVGTVKASNLNDTTDSYPADIVSHGLYLLYVATDDVPVSYGREVHQLIGTVDAVLEDINTTGSSNPENLTPVGSYVFFSADDTGFNNRELWVTDGTTGVAVGTIGTVMVKDINLAGSSVLENFVALGDWLLFTIEDGDELWRSDGTESGTNFVVETRDVGNSNISYATAHGNYVYFSANNGFTTDLWRSSGSIYGGSIQMTQPQAGGYGYHPEDIISCNNRLFFTGNHLSTGREIWENNGTSIDSGTTLLADINGTADTSLPSNLTCVGDKLYFTASDGVNGNELWVFDMSSTSGASSFPWSMFLDAINGEER